MSPRPAFTALEPFEIQDMDRESLERHLLAVYDFLHIQPGKAIVNCNKSCNAGKECKCYLSGVEWGEHHAECDGDCGAFDDGYSEGKRDAMRTLPENLVRPAEELKDAHEDMRLGIRTCDLSQVVERFVTFLRPYLP